MTPSRRASPRRAPRVRRPAAKRSRSVAAVLAGSPWLRPLVFAAVLTGASLLFALLLLPSVGAAGRALDRFNDQFIIPADDTDLAFPRFPERSQVHAADGSLLATLFGDENRTYVRLGEVNELARRAVLAIEDTKFYDHPGIDALGIMRAALANITAGGVEQGASTITQQLARNAFPDIGTERTLARKIHEAQVALRLERKYNKDQILELYLNRVYFGRGVYGIGTGAEFYFGKSAMDVTLAEAAMLAGLIAAPEKFNPVTDMQAALDRRNTVIQRMESLGWASEEEAAAAIATPIELKLTPRKKVRAPFFVTYVRNRILEDDRFGPTREARAQTLFQGGLQIQTTLQPKLERHGLNVVKGHLPLKEDPESATAVVDARTGAIKALVSSQKFKNSQVNLATGEGGTGRQLGSAMKPFTLVAAFEQGIPQTKVYNGANGILVDECVPPYRVNNADGSGGYMDLWAATQGSVNAVFVQLSVDAGLEKVVEVAHRMGIKSPLNPFCSLTLGTSEVNPLEVASGFQTLANGGVHCEPFAIRDVVDREGRRVEGFPEKKGDCKRVISEEIANLVVNMLENVVSGGTGTAAALPTWPEFGKTGSTNDLTNAWFSGCTRQICSATWVGHQDANLPMSNVHGRRVFGGTFPAMIWHDIMLEAMRGLKPIDFPGAPSPPSAVVPNVVGKTQAEAEKILSEANFTPIAEQVNSLEPVGTVAEQAPAGGSSVRAGSAVTIGLSNGKPPKVKLPNLVGLPEKTAVTRLSKLKLIAAVQYQPTADPALNGMVIGQSPGAGDKAKEGSTVTLVVYQYAPAIAPTTPPPTTPPPPPPTTPPESPGP